MLATDAILATLQTSNMIIRSYVSDFDDAELLRKPGEGCHHVAWQLGHLISSHNSLLQMVSPKYPIELPAGFAENHSKENADSTDPNKFCTKAQYLELLGQCETATQAVLAELTPEQLDQPGPEHLRSMFPTVGHLLVLIASHGLMHAGQFVPVRRALGKPVVI